MQQRPLISIMYEFNVLVNLEISYSEATVHVTLELPVHEFEETPETHTLKHLVLPSFHPSCRVELQCLQLREFPHNSKMVMYYLIRAESLDTIMPIA